MKKDIERIFFESIQVKKDTLSQCRDDIILAAREILSVFRQGGKIMFFGNGGSAADSQHAAAEFIGRFQRERRSLAAIALTTDTSILTALSNDYSVDIIFARQIEGLGRKGDIAFCISTSGNSANVVAGIDKACGMGIKTIALTGRSGGRLSSMVDICIRVPSDKTARIQEAHLCIIHTICQIVEDRI